MKKLKLWTFYRNIGLAVLNNLPMALLGFHPWMTLSALAHLRGWRRIERFINWVYDDKAHCRIAAKGWEQDRLRERNVGWQTASAGWTLIAVVVLVVWRLA